MSRGLMVAAVILSAGSVMVTPSSAQVGDEQRCVWSCLAGPGKGDPASSAYAACVAQRCSGGAVQGSTERKGDPRAAWDTGQTRSGMGWAGVDGRREGTGLYYFCGNGQSFLRVIGIDGGERGMIIDIDGTQFPLSFRPNTRNQPESPQSTFAPVMQALQSGNRVQVLGYEIGVIVDATLKGSSRALAQVISSC
ncbi:MAG: hypothetical protein AAFV19_12570 [Pseudomonadota bacterium]